MTIETIRGYIEDIDNEISILKTVVESNVQRNDIFAPMVVFYNRKNNQQVRDLVVVPKYYDDFSDRMRSVAEAMQLYSATRASAVIVAMVNQIIADDNRCHALTVFACNDDNAYMMQYPMTPQPDGSVEWHENLIEIVSVDNYDYDETGRELVSMLYMFVHMPNALFATSELLSYLTYNNAAISDMNNSYSYYDMSLDNAEVQ